MASQSKSTHRPYGLRIETPDDFVPALQPYYREGMEQNVETKPRRPTLVSSVASTETIRATAPVGIPSYHESGITTGSPSGMEQGSYMEHYMRNRGPQLGYNQDSSSDKSDLQQHVDEPAQKPIDIRSGGRSRVREIIEERTRHRSNSESTRDHYDPLTGNRLPEYSTSPPREQPRIGEGRFPLLQKTVDDMARESQPDISIQAMSLTSRSTVSPVSEEVRTPRDDEIQYPSSPLPISPNVNHISTSYESTDPRSFRRTASQRWRDGEGGAQDFFSRAGSLRRSYRDGNSFRTGSRRTTASSHNGNSVASSFLRGFSINSGDADGGAPPAVDAEGQTIGEDYVLGKQIGFGGFSVVKEVTQLSSETGKQRKLAVKIVRRNIEGKTEAENDAAQAEFEHEVELWRFLNHPNILPLESVYKLDEATFCFIPLNTGGTLFDLIRSNRNGISLELARNYAYQLASALRYLHLDTRIVHRDVKLENCLIDPTEGKSGLLRLCDFGMAEWVDSDHDTTSPVSRPGSRPGSADRPWQKALGPADSSSSAFAGGSLEYAAPEILRVATSTSTTSPAQDGHVAPSSFQRSHISPAVDIWAFGVCLYTMIVGKRPFTNSFSPKIVMAILAGDWDRGLLLEKSEQNEDLVDLVDGCLTIDQNRRWDIRTVVDCQWFDEEREQSETPSDDHSREWRL